MARGCFVRYRRYFRRYWARRRRLPVPNQNVAHGTACFDFQGGPGRYSMLAERFGIPANCSVKIYAAVVYIASDANCTPGVVRVQFGGGSEKCDVSVSRITYITAGYVRRFWLRAPYGADFHVHHHENVKQPKNNQLC
ncbi:Potassium channel [Dirofilaria immitis]